MLTSLAIAAAFGALEGREGLVPPTHRPGQDAPPVATICGMPVPRPARLPPPDGPPMLLAVMFCFDRQGGSSAIDPQTYLLHLRVRPSEPSRDAWVQYGDEVEQLLLQDFRRLWDTRFLDDLSVAVEDVRLANGAIAKVAVFHLEERQRLKIVSYEGSTRIGQSEIDQRLKDRGIALRIDGFLDPAELRSTAAIVRELYAEKGYQFVEVTPAVVPAAGGPKLVNVAFNVAEGPKVAIRDVEFLGNSQLDDETLMAAMKANRSQGLWSTFKGTGVYRAAKFADDADGVLALYRNHGFINARIGQPDLRSLEDSADGATRWVQLRVPVDEGRRYTVGSLLFEGNTRMSAEAFAALFRIQSGDRYSDQRIREGLDRARDAYGAGGYYEFTAYPDLKPRDLAPSNGPDGAGGAPHAAPGQPAVVDVTIRVQEGRQYYVNRITFAGNTHTRDDVIRRELALVEAGIFNTDALKYSLRRLNQLGYFKPLDADGVSVDKTAGTEDRVDLRVTVEEQNRNQLSFGAGASENEGMFGNASFTTSNFLGRGESATFSAQKGARSAFYQVAFTEPFLFGRPISAGFDLFSRKIDYHIYSNEVDYSEVRTGAGTSAGWGFRRFTRAFVAYGYEVIDTASSRALEAALGQGDTRRAVPILNEGRHTQSSVTPSLVYNTVDNPHAPRRGLRLTASYQAAGGWLGGSTTFIRPDLEGILYVPVTRRTAFGFRAQAGWIRNYRSSPLPYYLRFFLGGDTQIRGTELRSVGPVNANGAPLGGTRFVLFNGEYYVDLVRNVRALLFHDAGQAFAEGDPLDLRQLRTSSGAELRITLPMIGVPFRLIYAWNVYRDQSQPARVFRFAVGTSF